MHAVLYRLSRILGIPRLRSAFYGMRRSTECTEHIILSSPQKREYYYTDGGIRDDVICKVEQEAIRVAEAVQNFELTFS